MVILEGIIYKVFEQYVVLRGFAKIGDLASISEKIDSYQRDSTDSHKKDIIIFLTEGKYQYFPEIILAARANDYTNFLIDIGSNDDISPRSSQYVKGLSIKTEYIPTSGHRARHANYNVGQTKLKRVDGNHRLEPFDMGGDWWAGFDKEKVSKIIIPYSVIFTNDDVEDGANKFEAGIFNNINFKQLTLKQEKNIQNIHRFLKATEELGYAHNLTMQLIDLAEAGHFKGLTHLAPKSNKDDLYRTACFKIAKLLIDKKIEDNRIKNDLEKEINDIEKIIENIKIQSNDKELTFQKLEIYENRKNNKECYKTKIEYFLKNAENIDEIEVAIQSLRTVYARMKDNRIGNLSMLVALVYYKLMDDAKFNSFVDWIIRNGINNIPINDDLPTHDANSLITLFERVYEAKRKEIFISMQFDDPQSEMIYEKTLQTIKKFNKEVTLIRIDQTIEPNDFTIPEKIFQTIDDSSLLIADLSSRNVNVYHEIGYAMGVARTKDVKPHIILLYKTDTQINNDKMDMDKFIGFNLRTNSQLRFTNYKDLMNKLTERLEAYFNI